MNVFVFRWWLKKELMFPGSLDEQHGSQYSGDHGRWQEHRRELWNTRLTIVIAARIRSVG